MSSDRISTVVAQMQALRAEITEIMDRHGLSYDGAQVDNWAYSDRPASTTYIRFQLREAMTDYRSALAYLQAQAEKARELDAKLRKSSRSNH
jgi:hypothetical protein